MTNLVTVVAAPGVRVRGPDGSVLPEGGGQVVWSAFWQRRLEDGDIALAPVAPAPVVTKRGADHAG